MKQTKPVKRPVRTTAPGRLLKKILDRTEPKPRS